MRWRDEITDLCRLIVASPLLSHAGEVFAYPGGNAATPGGGMMMPKVTVYQYTVFDPKARSMRIAPRWATRKAIENLNRARAAAVILNDTEMEIDESYVDRDGMTEVGFRPSS
jgi:hypothetical protein